MIDCPQECANKCLELADVFCVGLDAGQRVICINSTGSRILQYRREEIEGRNWFDDFVPQRVREESRSKFLQLMRGEIALVEYRDAPVVTKDGMERVIAWHAALLTDEQGSVTGIVGAGEDVTERRRIEDELLASEERLARIIETTPNGIVVLDTGGEITYANPTAERILGLTRAEIAGRTYNDLKWRITTVDGKPLPDEELPFARAMKTGRAVFGVEHAVEHPDGTRTILSINAAPLRNIAGAIAGVVVSMSDITKSKQTEEELRRSETFFNSMFEESPHAMWISDDKGTLVRLNRALCRLLQVQESDVIGKYNVFLDNVVEEQGLLPLIRRVYENGETVTFSYTWDSRQEMQPGFARQTPVFLETTVSPVLDAKGRVINAIYQHIDFTERKRAEEALLESEEKYKGLFENTAEGVALHEVIYGEDGKPLEYIVRDVNNSFEKIIGISRDAAIGQRASALYGEAPYIEEFASVASTGIPIHFDTYFAPMNKYFSISVFRPKMGWFATILSDVTERIHVEEHQKEFYRKTILAATQGKLEITDRENILSIAGPVIGAWEIKPREDMCDVRAAVSQLAHTLGMEQSVLRDFVLCIGEAVTNAAKHAGGGMLSLHKMDDSLMAVISDNGPGIDALKLPEATMRLGYSTGPSMGMGYKMILSLTDKVYLATGPEGTIVGIEMMCVKHEEHLDIARLPYAW